MIYEKRVRFLVIAVFLMLFIFVILKHDLNQQKIFTFKNQEKFILFEKENNNDELINETDLKSQELKRIENENEYINEELISETDLINEKLFNRIKKENENSKRNNDNQSNIVNNIANINNNKNNNKNTIDDGVVTKNENTKRNYNNESNIVNNIANKNNNNNNKNTIDDGVVTENNVNKNSLPKIPSKMNNEEFEWLNQLERVVHIDLKGAPPKPDFFKSFIPLLKENGATGILLEYEDTFPYDGILADARHGNSYSLEDVNLIKTLAKENNLYIMPLVQTYGHLEWLLKLKKFAHLRDSAEFPQVITQCVEESYTVIFEMLDQVIKHHQDVPYFHIGCDEVFYKLTHPNCSKFNGDFTTAFWSHLTRVATHVRTRLPKAKIMFWDDMLHGMEEMNIQKFRDSIYKLELIPMIWGYMENVPSYFQPSLYEKYGRIFQNVWIASAYKGASGELSAITSIQHHYLNHISWIDVLLEKHRNKIVNFTGIALTGWSRYDHFLVLCDILPIAIPSLVFNLQTMQLGEINEEKKNQITMNMGCNGKIPWSHQELESNFMITCNFPAHEVYEAILPLNNVVSSIQPNLEFAKKYMTTVNLDNSYLHKARAYEVLTRLDYNLNTLKAYKNRFIESCKKYYWDETIYEWLEVYFMSHYKDVNDIVKKIRKNIQINDWKPRPFVDKKIFETKFD